MIIDLILDRKEDEELIKSGYDSVMFPNGITRQLAYNARDFYHSVMKYGEIGENITEAMDYGTEADVKAALCIYIMQNGYNPGICYFINSVNWLN